MREFELVIDEALRKGLSPFKTTLFNTQLLKECFGFRLSASGLEKYEVKENPLPSTTDLFYSWPFPQFVTGERYNFLIVRDDETDNEDVVYSVSDDHSTVSHVFTIDQATYGQGTLMEVADFGKFAFMTNGVIMVFWVAGSWAGITSSSLIPLMRTVCNFKGQLVGGNVVSSWHDCDEKFYVWSKIGQADFTPDNYNLAGYRRDPFGGEVYHTRRLGDNVIGYSSEGITLISPVSSPAATFGFTELSNIGLKNQGAMNGDLDKQVYVGEDDILREVSRQGIKELGYEYYMEQLGEVIVCYDKKYKDFYIGDDEKTFLLTPTGLTEIPQHPSTVWRNNSGTYMLPESSDDRYMQIIVTHPFDMGYGGQKTVFGIETDLIRGKAAEVAVDYYSDMMEYYTTRYVPLNNQGIASLIASGNAFAVRLKFDPRFDGSMISYIKARYKMTDLRGIRGVYAPPPREQ